MFYARGFAPCIPGAEPGRHWLSLPSTSPAGGAGGWSPACPAAVVPCGGQGGLPSLAPAYPAFSLLSFPHPPNPLPSGKGGTKSLFRRGLRPRHPCTEPLAALTVPAQQVLRRLNPRGTGCPCRTGARRGLVLFAVRLPCRCGVRRGACLLCRLSALPLVCFTAPYPPNPLPGGKGETKSLFRRGLRPRHPCAEPLAALTEPAVQVISGVACPGGTGYPCPGGEDHLKRRRRVSDGCSISPGPPSPWLPALPPRKQTETFGRASAASLPAPGMQGAKPLA